MTSTPGDFSFHAAVQAKREADAEIFKKATNLINSKLPRPRSSSDDGGDFIALGGGAAPRPGGRITFHEKIGAHDISVAHVESGERFVQWAKDYLKTLGVDTPTIPEALISVINAYIRENFKW